MVQEDTGGSAAYGLCPIPFSVTLLARNSRGLSRRQKRPEKGAASRAGGEWTQNVRRRRGTER